MPTGADGRLLPAEAVFLRKEIERLWQNVNRFATMKDYDPSYLSRVLGSKKSPGTKKGAGVGLGQLRDLCRDVGIAMWTVFSEAQQEAPAPPPLTVADIAAEILRLGEELERLSSRPPLTDRAQQLVAETLPEIQAQDGKVGGRRTAGRPRGRGPESPQSRQRRKAPASNGRS